tara:strand:- start:158 stop:610 length:453 start_codon:yes stop_codon:yes gene_type:complete
MTVLKGKTVIMTGAAGCIGRAIVEEAGRVGARLALVDADAERLDATVTAIRTNGAEVLPFAIDMTNRALWQKIINDIAAHFGGIDVMVNNAMWVKYELMTVVQEEVLSAPDGDRHGRSLLEHRGGHAAYDRAGIGQYRLHDVARIGSRHS